MVSIDYSALKTKVSGLLSDLGTTVVISRSTKGARDASTGKSTTTTSTSTAKGVVQNFTNEELRGGIIKSTSKKILLDPTISIAPQTGDSLTVQGVVYKIGMVKVEQPADEILLYICEAQI